MKSYLDLIPISAKVHRKQTRMTRICIVISVFLIAAIFGMADMFLQGQMNQIIMTDGAWHAAFRGLSEEQMEWIGMRPDVKAGCRYALANNRLDQGYKIDGTQTLILGFDETFFDIYPSMKPVEGSFPQGEHEAMIPAFVRDRLGVSIGDTVTLETPDGMITVRISGITGDESSLLRAGAFALCFDTKTFQTHFPENAEDLYYFVICASNRAIQRTVDDIRTQFAIPEDAIGLNGNLMMVLLQSHDSYVMVLYGVAVILAILVAFAGMLMILGSLNSNVAQRTEFFGMMRCLGATGKQIRRFVRLEALLWCRAAIPCGLAAGTVVIWILCAVLKVLSPTYFGGMPVFGISWLGILLGCVIGLLTVLVASGTPAKKASKVSPLAAVSGNANTVFAAKRAANTRVLRVETALGIHHATGSRKNLLLLTASFALSIILFLSFSTGIVFMRHALTPLQPYTPDVSVVSKDNRCDVPDSVLAQIKALPSVERAFGRSFAYNLPVRLHGEAKTVDLISYESCQFGWAADDLLDGSMESAQSGDGVLLVAATDFSAQVGDEVVIETKLGAQSVPVVGILGYVPFNSGKDVGKLICSESLFRQLTGETGYTIIDVQLSGRSDSTAQAILEIAGNGFNFADRRASNTEIRSSFYAYTLFVYGFLTVIALIAAFNIVNSIDMSTSARIHEYGAMRAIGTSIKQLNAMVIAETATYLICGLIAGLTLGMPLHFFLFRQMITERWGDAWTLPFGEFGVIAAVLTISAVVAIAGPVRRIKRMSVVETIGAQ